MLKVREILLMLARQVEETGLPVPAPESIVSDWARGLDLPRRGKLLLYTGALYQVMPYINAVVRYLEKLEGAPGSGGLLGVARRLGGSKLARLAIRPDKGEVEYSRRVLRSIVRLLREAGVEVAYDPGLDGYSGVLLYDLGLDEAFRRHAEKVARGLQDSGAETIVTVDPHTTHVLRSVYPKLFPWFTLNVKTYLEVLDEAGYKPASTGKGRVTIHDPCLYARFEGVVEQPRRLLRLRGLEIVEPRRSGRMTYCCGGPLESVAPRLSRRIAETRLRELVEASRTIVTLCPICYANLSRVSDGRAEIRDIAIVLGGEGV